MSEPVTEVCWDEEGMYRESYDVEVCAETIRSYANTRRKLLEMNCKHLVGISVQTIPGRTIKIELVNKTTGNVISEFIVEDGFMHTFSDRPITLDGMLEIYFTPQHYARKPEHEITIRTYHTKFKNGLEEAKSLAKHRASANQISDQGLSYDQGPHARVPQYGPYRRLDEDE